MRKTITYYSDDDDDIRQLEELHEITEYFKEENHSEDYMDFWDEKLDCDEIDEQEHAFMIGWEEAG